MPESSYWQLCPPSKSGLQGGLLSSSFPPGPVPLVPADGPLQPPVDAGPSQPRPLAPGSPSSSPPAVALAPGPPPPPPPPPKRHCRSLSVPEDLSRCRYTWRPSASRVWTPVGRQQAGAMATAAAGGAGGGGVGGGACPLRAPSSSLNSSLHSSSSPTFFSLALSPDSPLPWSFPWDAGEAAAGGGGGGACCCFFPSPSSSSPSPLHPPPPPQRRFSLSPVLIRDAAAAASAMACENRHFHMAAAAVAPPPPPPGRPPGVPVPASPSSACSTPSCRRRSAPPPPPLPRCHSQPCDLLLLKPGLKRRRDPDRPAARPGLDFTKMTQTRSLDPQALERGGRAACGGGELDPIMADLRGSPGRGRSSIGPLGESDEECREEEEEEEEEPRPPVFERDCTELDLNLIEEN